MKPWLKTSLVGVLSLGMLACASNTVSSTPAMSSQNKQSLSGRWTLVSLQQFSQVDENTPVKAVLDLSAMPHGYAYAGCNHMNFSVEDLNSGQVVIGVVASTRMACEDMMLDYVFGEYLPSMNQYQLEANTLTLSNDQQQKMVFVKSQDSQ